MPMPMPMSASMSASMPAREREPAQAPWLAVAALAAVAAPVAPAIVEPLRWAPARQHESPGRPMPARLPPLQKAAWGHDRRPEPRGPPAVHVGFRPACSTLGRCGLAFAVWEAHWRWRRPGSAWRASATACAVPQDLTRRGPRRRPAEGQFFGDTRDDGVAPDRGRHCVHLGLASAYAAPDVPKRFRARRRTHRLPAYRLRAASAVRRVAPRARHSLGNGIGQQCDPNQPCGHQPAESDSGRACVGKRRGLCPCGRAAKRDHHDKCAQRSRGRCSRPGRRHLQRDEATRLVVFRAMAHRAARVIQRSCPKSFGSLIAIYQRQHAIRVGDRERRHQP